MNGALEAVEDVHFAVAFNFDGLVVVVSAMFAFSHKDFTLVNISPAHKIHLHRLRFSEIARVLVRLDHVASFRY